VHINARRVIAGSRQATATKGVEDENRLLAKSKTSRDCSETVVRWEDVF
jgi:hypothetical protein